MDIYLAYTPTATSRRLKREGYYQQVVDMFVEVCKEEDAVDADKVQIPVPEGNSNVWDVIKRTLPQFETATKLTLFESKVMTIVRRDKQIAAALAAANPAPVTPT